MMLPPDHPDAPKYWMYETSGELRSAVERYLAGEPLSDRQVRLMKAYLWQWVKAPVWGGSGVLEALRLRVALIEEQRDVRECIRAAEEMGMDPL